MAPSFPWRKHLRAAMAAVIGSQLALTAIALPARADSPTSPAATTCALGGGVQHVISVEFDNVHFTRDNPNVPSDLEQMPNLLNFIKSNGALDTNHHTPLIAHTATDILTSLTGLYGDRMGVPISNSFGYFKSDGSVAFAPSFTYWTTPVSTADPNYNMIAAPGTDAPAPWVPFTRAGCNVGGFSTANIEFENPAIDVPTVYGPNSPQEAEVKADPKQAVTDFEGVAVHCAQGAATCAAANNGVADVLPSEPGGYSGFNGLFGAKYVMPVISPSGPMVDLDGNVINGANSNPGFPGFDPTASQSLGYVAAMQEHGIPVTYAYIADAHDNHAGHAAFGPGEAGYVSTLKSYDAAWGKFFARLATDGIDQHNTLFVFTADEGDHFVGGAPSPAGCDGVTTPCTYSQIGELTGNLTGLLATQQSITTPFSVHSDSAPNFYVKGNPGQTDATTRSLEQAVGKLTATNPLSGNTDTLTNFLADQAEMKLLHMVTADPARTPTFTMFAKPDYFLVTGAANCTSPCVSENPAFAWNHGDVAPEINNTWLGLVGPGVKPLGVTDQAWSDHTDVRPTMMTLVGLKDDYTHQGRALFELLADVTVPQTLRAHRETLIRLAQAYKQINAAVGQLGLDSLKIATAAAESNTPGDATYTQLVSEISSVTSQRDSLAGQMEGLLSAATFNGQALDEQQAKSLIDQAQTLLKRVSQDAANASVAPTPTATVTPTVTPTGTAASTTPTPTTTASASTATATATGTVTPTRTVTATATP